jgi:hypothetical protein
MKRVLLFCDRVRSNNKVVSLFVNVDVSGGTPPSILNLSPGWRNIFNIKVTCYVLFLFVTAMLLQCL